MPPWMVFTFGGLFASFGVFVGLLMFLSPARFRRFNAWWSRADEWSVARSEAVPQGSESEARLVGLALAAMFAFFLRLSLVGLLHVIRGSEPTPHIVAPVGGGAGNSGVWETWSSFIPGPIFVAAGLWYLLKPEAVVERFAKSWPESNHLGFEAHPSDYGRANLRRDYAVRRSVLALDCVRPLAFLSGGGHTSDHVLGQFIGGAMESQTLLGSPSAVQASRYSGITPGARRFLFLLVTLVACITEVVLLMTLWRASNWPSSSAWLYTLPVFHLLPWFGGLQLLRKARREATLGAPEDRAATVYDMAILLMMLAAYAALGATESMLGTAWALANSNPPF
jgi:hypothetical protein